jgi:hypothetical protein
VKVDILTDKLQKRWFELLLEECHSPSLERTRPTWIAYSLQWDVVRKGGNTRLKRGSKFRQTKVVSRCSDTFWWKAPGCRPVPVTRLQSINRIVKHISILMLSGKFWRHLQASHDDRISRVCGGLRASKLYPCLWEIITTFGLQSQSTSSQLLDWYPRSCIK